MVDVDLIRLQYEILGVPLEVLASRFELPLSLLEAEAEKNQWTRLWDDDDAPVIDEDEEDPFSVKAEDYIDKTRKKLVAFSLAKEILLTQRYLDLESGILKKASEILENIDGSSNAVNATRTLASLYRDMAKGSISTGYNPSAVTIGTDESGIPTAIIRDLSGQSGLKK